MPSGALCPYQDHSSAPCVCCMVTKTGAPWERVSYRGRSPAKLQASLVAEGIESGSCSEDLDPLVTTIAQSVARSIPLRCDLLDKVCS